MIERPRRTHRRTLGGNPLSFFAIANLYTIEECSRNSRTMTLDHIEEEVASAHSGLTALPRWEKSQSSKRSHARLPRWEDIQSPRRTHSRHGSQDPVLEKNAYPTEADLVFPPPPTRSGASTPADPENPRHSRMIVWLVVVVVVVLALAIVLGAVLGTFVNPGGHSTGPEPLITEIPAGTTPTPTAPPSGGDAPQPTSLSKIPALAVTGWSVPGPSGYFIVWLFSQAADGYLSSHSFNSSTGNWTRVSNFASAKRDTPLAAAALNTEYYTDQPNYEFPDIHYQAEVAYLDDKNYLSEWVFPDTGPAIGQPGSLIDQMEMAHQDTKLAFYWPSLIYQGLSGEVREVHFECHSRNECWHENVLRTSEASNGTRLSTVPMANNQSSTGLFYEEEGGRHLNYKEVNGEAVEIWANGAFSDLIPPNASITSFSTTRDDSDTALNTYLLWQDAEGTIQMSWADTDQGWRGPITHPAFADADNNTALACLTGLTFPKFPLPEGTELSRCYFQTGGAVREVSFDGTSWDVVGNVPTFGF